jgi:hypothetical protein
VVVEAVRAVARRRRPSFRTLSVHESRALLLYGIERRVPVQVVVGKAGSGKSRLMGALSRTAIQGATLLLVRELPSSFEAAILLLAEQLDVVLRPGESPFERLVRLAEVLAERRRSGRLVALIVDDAHVAEGDALRTLCMLAGTDADGGALLPIVLAGRPELVGRLDEPELESLRLGVGTQIELLRPLPADVGPDAAVSREPSRVPRSRRWTAAAGAMMAAGLVAVVAVRAPVPVAVSRWRSPFQAQALALKPSSPFVGPPRSWGTRDTAVSTAVPARADADGPRLTADGVRSLVADLAAAVERRDVGRIERLLSRDARQNGVRGRTAIVGSYAYRFTHVDAPTAIGAPERIVLRDGMAFADVPFETAYRDAAGRVGTVTGTLSLRIVRHGARLVLDTLDYGFGSPRT